MHVYLEETLKVDYCGIINISLPLINSAITKEVINLVLQFGFAVMKFSLAIKCFGSNYKRPILALNVSGSQRLPVYNFMYESPSFHIKFEVSISIMTKIYIRESGCN